MAGQEMFALDDLARLFNVVVREDAAAGGLTVTAGTQTILVTGGVIGRTGDYAIDLRPRP